MNKKARSYMCQLCGQNFVLKSSLDIHTLGHKESKKDQVRTGEIIPEINAANELSVSELKIDRNSKVAMENKKQKKPYKCSACGRAFNLKICLKTHSVNCKVDDPSPVVSKEDDAFLSRSSSIPITLTDGGADVASAVVSSTNDEVIDGLPIHIDSVYSLVGSSNTKTVPAKCQLSTSPISEKFGSISLVSFDRVCNQSSVVRTETSIKEKISFPDLQKANIIKVYTKKSHTEHRYATESIECKVDEPNISLDDDHLQQLGNWDKTQEILTTTVKELCKDDHIQNTTYASRGNFGKRSINYLHNCVICKYSFKSKKVLNEHIELGNYNCNDCEETFPVCVLLKNHKVSHLKHHCPSCEKAFSSRHILDYHCNQNSYNCDLCKATFSSCKDAKTHWEAHLESRCRTCEEIFHSKEALDDHRLKKPYYCQFCEQSFDSCAVARRHQILHTSGQKTKKSNKRSLPKSCRCMSCSESFPSRKDLRFHHESNSKFHCSKCGKKMCSEVSLIKHNEQKTFNCFLCVETFLSCEKISAHRKSHRNRLCSKCKRVFSTEESLIMHAAQDSHLCEVCDEIFPLCESLKSHMKSHALKCKFCHKSFLYLSTLHKHESRHSMEELKCEHCGQEFSSLSKVKQHVKKVHIPEDEVLCTVCGNVLKSSVYRNHECLHNAGLEKFQCEKCGISFIEKKQFERHEKLHVGGAKYHCRFCKEGFILKKNLTVHLRSHAGEKPFPCNDCGLKFKTKYNLDLHLRSHNTEDKTFKCHVCFREFRIALALNQHLRTHFSSEELSHITCKICGKEFQFKNRLAVHYMEHTKEEREKAGVTKVQIKTHSKTENLKRLECNHCDKKFISKVALESHKTRHTGEKPFKCSVCEKVFSGYQSRRLHMRMYHYHKQFKCTECGKSFPMKSKFKEHMRIHTGEKPFECQECNKSFRLKPGLEKHMRTHTGERPYKCEICQKTFIQLAHANAHIVIHSGQRPYQCEQCGAAFAARSNMLQHRKIHLKNKGT